MNFQRSDIGIFLSGKAFSPPTDTDIRSGLLAGRWEAANKLFDTGAVVVRPHSFVCHFSNTNEMASLDQRK